MLTHETDYKNCILFFNQKFFGFFPSLKMKLKKKVKKLQSYRFSHTELFEKSAKYHVFS